jgi:ribosomal protein S5
MFFLDRFEKRTVYSTLEQTVCGSTVKLYSAGQGYGVVANSTVHEVKLSKLRVIAVL